nr:hemopexin [Loxodonta africana]
MAGGTGAPVVLGLLGLCWSLAIAYPLASTSAPVNEAEGGNGTKPDPDILEQCSDGWGFDAATLDDSGTMLFFKGDFVWKGHEWARESISEHWKNFTGHVDAAFRRGHDSVFLIKGDKVWVYPPGKKEKGYPKLLQDEFPGIPSPLDAAVECPRGECQQEGVLFFQGQFRLKSKMLGWLGMLVVVVSIIMVIVVVIMVLVEQLNGFLRKRRTRETGYSLQVKYWAERMTGRHVGQGHGPGHSNRTDHGSGTYPGMGNRPGRCSPDLVLSALLSDIHGATYAFAGSHYWRLDTSRDGWHSWPVAHQWPQGPSAVDAAFSWDDKLYLIQGTQVYIFLTKAGYNLVSGYPKRLEKELGSPHGLSLDAVDAAFTCPGSSRLHIMAGQRLWWLDLQLGAQAVWTALPWPHNKVDAALCVEKSLGPNSCSADGPSLYLIHGPSVYCYSDVDKLNAAKALPQPQKVADLLGCSHSGAP